MKKTALALTLVLALSVSTIELQFVSKARANFIGAIILPNEPNTTPPTIVVHSPVQNQTCKSTQVWLNFTIIKPEGFFGNITSVWYTFDGGETQQIEVHDRFINNSDSIYLPIKELNFSTSLNLTVGAHSVKVSLEAQSFYINYAGPPQGWVYPSVWVHAESETVRFTHPLSVDVMSPEKGTYNTSSIPLNLIVDAVGPQITYCLDGKENITIAGNVTLAELANGDHNLTIFARDIAGNVGASETIHFSVEVPAPLPTFQVVVAVAVVIAVAALVYLKKRKSEVGLS